MRHLRPLKIINHRFNTIKKLSQKSLQTVSEDIAKGLKVSHISGPLQFGKDISKKNYEKLFSNRVTVREMHENARALQESSKNGPSY